MGSDSSKPKKPKKIPPPDSKFSELTTEPLKKKAKVGKNGLTREQTQELKQSLYSEQLFDDMQVIGKKTTTSGSSNGGNSSTHSGTPSSKRSKQKLDPDFAQQTKSKKERFKTQLANENKKSQQIFHDHLKSKQKDAFAQNNLQMSHRLPKNFESPLLNSMENACCIQCTIAYPLMCWRQKLKRYLELGQLCGASEIGNDKLEGFKKIDIAWKQNLLRKVKHDGEAIIAQTKDKDFQIQFFEQFGLTQQQNQQAQKTETNLKTLHQQRMRRSTAIPLGHGKPDLGLNLSPMAPVRQSMDFQVSQSAGFPDRQSKTNTFKAENFLESPSHGVSGFLFDEEESKITGQSALYGKEMGDGETNFYDQVLFIKRQLSEKYHPIRSLIEYFKVQFSDKCEVLLCVTVDENAKELLADATFEEKLAYAKASLLRIINVFVDTLLIFYNLDVVVRPHDLKREFFVNLITNIVLSDELYFLVFNVISNCYRNDLQKLQYIMNNVSILENKLPIHKLNLDPEFQFDLPTRNKYQRVEATSQASIISDKSIKPDGYQFNIGLDGTINTDVFVLKGDPYSEVRKQLFRVKEFESPMCKLEHIYEVCTKEVVEEIDAFWKGFDIPASKLSVDTDNLQGILIYVISRIKYPQIYTEVVLADIFLPRNVKKSCRTLYLEMIKASCQLLLKVDTESKSKSKQKEAIYQPFGFSDEPRPSQRSGRPSRPVTQQAKDNAHFVIDGADVSSLGDNSDGGLEVGDSGFILGQSIVPDKGPLVDSPEINDPYQNIEEPSDLIISPDFRRPSFEDLPKEGEQPVSVSQAQKGTVKLKPKAGLGQKRASASDLVEMVRNTEMVKHPERLFDDELEEEYNIDQFKNSCLVLDDHEQKEIFQGVYEKVRELRIYEERRQRKTEIKKQNTQPFKKEIIAGSLPQNASHLGGDSTDLLYDELEEPDEEIQVEMVEDEEFEVDERDDQDIEGLMFERNKVLIDDLAPTRNTFQNKDKNR